jgi:hypothetical protein
VRAEPRSRSPRPGQQAYKITPEGTELLLTLFNLDRALGRFPTWCEIREAMGWKAGRKGRNVARALEPLERLGLIDVESNAAGHIIGASLSTKARALARAVKL